MMLRGSPGRKRLTRELGEHIKRWRVLQNLSASELARRASVTRETLRHIEEGTGNPRLESVLAVTQTLGFAKSLVSGADPLKSDAGRALVFSD